MQVNKKSLDLESMFPDTLENAKINGNSLFLELSFATFHLRLNHDEKKGEIELDKVCDKDVSRDVKCAIRKIETRLGFMLLKGAKIITYLNLTQKKSKFSI